MRHLARMFGGFLLWTVGGVAGVADEGMWLFNDLPRDYLAREYGIVPDDDWARHVMLASVRFNSGGSASFVSSRGLVLTNHHVGADTLYKLSTPERNLHRDGFLAERFEDELPAPDLELNQLVSIEDVTQRVNAAVTPGMTPAEAFPARRAAMAEIEKESLTNTGLRSDVVTLYGGAKYHLYRYKKYTDVRLVWAPEAAAAFFGGDADNFEYPRYCLDVCLFRVYEQGKPAAIEHYLPVHAPGPADGELVFVSGNPGSTNRIYTVAALKYERDIRLPFVLDYLRRGEIVVQQYQLAGPEAERRARDELFGIQNSRKAYLGMLAGLQDPSFIARKEAEELKLLDALKARPGNEAAVEAWADIAEVVAKRATMLRRGASFSSDLYRIAEQLVLMSKEDLKPSEQRIREYRDSARESLLQQLFSPAPIYEDLEQVKMADALSLFIERRGGDAPIVRDVLAGKGPRERAAELVLGTRLADVQERKRLADGGVPAIEASDDPMIRLALQMEDEFRAVRKINDELDEVERQAYAKITQARYEQLGTSTYPDATFTLRLAFGKVLGYEEAGQQIPPWTTIGGAFESERLHEGKDPWRFPTSWHEAQDRLDMDVPFNFVCTADIIGGNSGSPVINAHKQLVGVIFDGNIQSLTARYFYTDHLARAVAVHAGAVVESLRKVYDAKRLVHELLSE